MLVLGRRFSHVYGLFKAGDGVDIILWKCKDEPAFQWAPPGKFETLWPKMAKTRKWTGSSSSSRASLASC